MQKPVKGRLGPFAPPMGMSAASIALTGIRCFPSAALYKIIPAIDGEIEKADVLTWRRVWLDQITCNLRGTNPHRRRTNFGGPGVGAKAERNVHGSHIKQQITTTQRRSRCLFDRIDGAARSGSAGRLLLTQSKGARQWVSRLQPSYPIPHSKTCRNKSEQVETPDTSLDLLQLQQPRRSWKWLS
jgi:hypothetical protein